MMHAVPAAAAWESSCPRRCALQRRRERTAMARASHSEEVRRLLCRVICGDDPRGGKGAAIGGGGWAVPSGWGDGGEEAGEEDEASAELMRRLAPGCDGDEPWGVGPVACVDADTGPEGFVLPPSLLQLELLLSQASAAPRRASARSSHHPYPTATRSHPPLPTQPHAVPSHSVSPHHTIPAHPSPNCTTGRPGRHHIARSPRHTRRHTRHHRRGYHHYRRRRHHRRGRRTHH